MGPKFTPISKHFRSMDTYETALNFNDPVHQGDRRKKSQQCFRDAIFNVFLPTRNQVYPPMFLNFLANRYDMRWCHPPVWNNIEKPCVSPVLQVWPVSLCTRTWRSPNQRLSLDPSMQLSGHVLQIWATPIQINNWHPIGGFLGKEQWFHNSNSWTSTVMMVLNQHLWNLWLSMTINCLCHCLLGTVSSNMIFPHRPKVQQRGVGACKSILLQLLDGMNTTHAQPVLVVDMAPSRQMWLKPNTPSIPSIIQTQSSRLLTWTKWYQMVSLRLVFNSSISCFSPCSPDQVLRVDSGLLGTTAGCSVGCRGCQ